MVETQAEKSAAEEQRFARNVQRLREDRGWSQTELARRMVAVGWKNYTQMTISRTEKCERPLRLSEARSLATILDSSLDEMMLPGVDSKILDDLNNAIDSLMDAQDTIHLAVKTFMITRGNVYLYLKVTEKLETRTWDNPEAIRRLRELESVARNVAEPTLQSVVDDAVAKWQTYGG